MWTEEQHNKLLTTPSERLVEDLKKICINIIVLGAGGKMGSTLHVPAQHALQLACIHKRTISVSLPDVSDARTEILVIEDAQGYCSRGWQEGETVTLTMRPNSFALLRTAR